MELVGTTALVTGGASGLGAATARELVARGAKVVIADVDEASGSQLAEQLGEQARFVSCDVTDADQVSSAVATASELGAFRIAVGCAGIGHAGRMAGRDGEVDVAAFERVVRVNLIGMYNLLAHASTAIAETQPVEGDERGAIVMTASIAAFDGQVGQTAYAAAKGGVVALTLPAARELSSKGVRVVTIAPGLFDTPLLAGLPEPARVALGESVPFPSRLGDPPEFAALVTSIAENTMLNGETIRLDGGLRMGMR